MSVPKRTESNQHLYELLKDLEDLKLQNASQLSQIKTMKTENDFYKFFVDNTINMLNDNDMIKDFDSIDEFRKSLLYAFERIDELKKGYKMMDSLKKMGEDINHEK